MLRTKFLGFIFVVVVTLAGAQDLRAPDERIYRTIHPSIVQTLPDDFPELKHEFSKLESQMFDRPRKRAAEPLTPILPDAHDRIFTPGYVGRRRGFQTCGVFHPKRWVGNPLWVGRESVIMPRWVGGGFWC